MRCTWRTASPAAPRPRSWRAAGASTWRRCLRGALGECRRCAAPRVFRVPPGPAVGPGCFVCRRAAARPRIYLLRRALHPIRRHYTPSVRVQRHTTGAAPPIMRMTLATTVGMYPCETADSDRRRPALEPPTSAVRMRGSMPGTALTTQSPRLSVASDPHSLATRIDR